MGITRTPRRRAARRAADPTGAALCIAFANHKGGCGKTTAVGNLGAALAEMGERVLLIDADPQANLSELFGLGDPMVPGPRLEDALTAPADQPPAAWAARVDDLGQVIELPHGLHLLPCTEELSETVMEHEVREGFEGRLSELVAAYRADYDYILIDTPPGIQPLTTMAMLAADRVLIPARPADFDITGAVKLADFIDERIREYNPGLQVLGVLISQTDSRWKLGREAAQALGQAGLTKLFHEIPFAVRVGTAPRHSQPTVALEPDSRVAYAYRQTARMLHADLHNHKAAA